MRKKTAGRKKTTEKFATATGVGTPLAVGRIIAHLMRKGLTYERARLYFIETLSAPEPGTFGSRLSKNTVDKYWQQYKQTIREPARRAGRDEKEFCAAFFTKQSARRLREIVERHRDQITVEIRSPLSTEELAAALVDIAKNEAVRVHKQSIAADYLTVTINYRHPKKKPRR